MLLIAGKGKSCSCCYPHSPGCGYCPLRYRTSLRNSAPSQSAHHTSPRSGSIGERGGRRGSQRPELPPRIFNENRRANGQAPARDRADLPGPRRLVTDTISAQRSSQENMLIPARSSQESRDMIPGPELARASACSCLLYTSPSPRDRSLSRMPSSA